jgi:hypothetical protein
MILGDILYEIGGMNKCRMAHFSSLGKENTRVLATLHLPADRTKSDCITSTSAAKFENLITVNWISGVGCNVKVVEQYCFVTTRSYGSTATSTTNVIDVFV